MYPLSRTCTYTHNKHTLDLIHCYNAMKDGQISECRKPSPYRAHRETEGRVFFLSEVTYKAAKSPTDSSSYMTAKTGLEPWGQNRMREIAKQGYLAGQICCAENKNGFLKGCFCDDAHGHWYHHVAIIAPPYSPPFFSFLLLPVNSIQHERQVWMKRGKDEIEKHIIRLDTSSVPCENNCEIHLRNSSSASAYFVIFLKYWTVSQCWPFLLVTDCLN